MTAPDQCCINVKKLLSIRRRPHMTQTGHGPGRNPAVLGLRSPPVRSACAFTSMRRSHYAVRREADDVARSIPIDVGQLARVGGVAAPTGIGTKDRELECRRCKVPASGG